MYQQANQVVVIQVQELALENSPHRRSSQRYMCNLYPAYLTSSLFTFIPYMHICTCRLVGVVLQMISNPHQWLYIFKIAKAISCVEYILYSVIVAIFNPDRTKPQNNQVVVVHL